MKKEYLELELEIVTLLQNDIVTASVPGEGDKTSDPYDSGNNWWD